MAARRRRIVWTPRAVSALDDAIAYIASSSPAAAEQVLMQVLESAESLAELTERGRILPEMSNPAVRELMVTSYRLIYKYDSSHVTILAILHTSQQFRRFVDDVTPGT